MILRNLQEPFLEFGNGKHLDVRYGLMAGGPADLGKPGAPSQIKLGIVGSTETVAAVRTWLSSSGQAIESAKPGLANLRPSFPGVSDQHTLFTETEEVDSALVRLPNSKIQEAIGKGDNDSISEFAAHLFNDAIGIILESAPSVDVVLCAVPYELLRAMVVKPKGVTETKIDFHDLLKALAFQHGKPIQIVLPSTYDKSKPALNRNGTARSSQDDATTAWNFYVALYYKAGGTPWRLERSASDLHSCYVGVGFYKGIEGEMMATSVAQIFNDRGEGMILRGGPAKISAADKQPHLARDPISVGALQSHARQPSRTCCFAQIVGVRSERIPGIRGSHLDEGDQLR